MTVASQASKDVGFSNSLKILSCNPSGWQPLKRALDLTEAHVVMTQDTKKLKEDVPQQQKDAMIAGWRAFCNPGYIKHAAPSAGVATLVRRCFAASLPLGTGDGNVALGWASRVHVDAYASGG